MPKQLTEKELARILKDLQHAAADMHKATEEYLHATIEIAKLQGPKTWKKVKPHILHVAKMEDRLHKHLTRKH